MAGERSQKTNFKRELCRMENGNGGSVEDEVVEERAGD
jgi:hypothetical protein